MKSNQFVHLHVHSEYSMLDGYGKPEQFILRAKELGQPAIALTDHGNIFGHYKWWDTCRKNGVKPILGCELYIIDNVHSQQRWNNHLTVLAKNVAGLRNLNKLLSFAWEGGFYYKPRVDWDLLKKHGDGLIVLSGCTASRLAHQIRSDVSDKELATEIKRQKDCVEHYFLEVSQWQTDDGLKIASKVLQMESRFRRKIPAVMTMDAHFPLSTHAVVQDALLAIQMNEKISNPNRMKLQKDLFIKSRIEMDTGWNVLFPDLANEQSHLLDNSLMVADLVDDYDFPRSSPADFPFKGDKFKHLKSLCAKGMKFRGTTSPEHKKRLDYELKLVDSKGFVDYFLIVHDMVQWAKSNNILVGAARGSSCGSLVCYVLGITEIDPLKFGLLFERFIDVNRTDLPDIDIDFQDNKREEVKNYLVRRYGDDKVATLTTFGTFQGRMCIQDIGRAFEIPSKITEEFKNMIVQRSGGDSRFGFGVVDTIKGFKRAGEIADQYPAINIAADLEGKIRHRGIHAAGVVVSKEPIENFASVFVDKKSGVRVIGMDYDDATAVGLMKIDVLGLNALTIIQDCLSSIKERHNLDLDIWKVPLDDKKVFKSFQDGKLVGVFQFDGKAQATVCKQVKPKSFDDIIAIGALSRPGSLNSGSTTDFIARQSGQKQIEYEHPMMKTVTESTLGVPLYQEQVMLVVKNIGNFDWSGVGAVRKLMSKRLGTESFEKHFQEFLVGARQNKVTDEVAKKIWDRICTFGSWAFNKSHSVAYGLTGYCMMWLKVHYPLEFYCSLLRNEKDEETLALAVNEFRKSGHELFPIHINKSKANFSIDGKGIRVGFQTIKGLGEAQAVRIEASQPIISFNQAKKFFAKQSETLYKLGAFNGLPIGWKGDNATLSLFEEEKSELIDVPTSESVIQEFCPILSLATPHHDFADIVRDRWGEEPVKASEVDFSSKGHCILIGRTNTSLFNLNNKVNESIKKGTPFDAKGRPNDEFDFVTFPLQDESGFVSVRVSYKKYPDLKETLWAIKPTDTLVVVVSIMEGINMVFANEVAVLNPNERSQECPF